MDTITEFPCPVDGCKVFPFETAEDLEGHLEHEDHVFSWGRGRQAATEAPRRWGQGSGSGRGAGRPAARREPAWKSEPATAPQLGRIRRTAEALGLPVPPLEGLTKGEASAIIDSLGEPPAAPVRQAEPEVPEGDHLLDGVLLTVKRARTSGQLYAVTAGGEYLGKRGLKGLSAATVLTLELAQAYGRRTGTCCCCRRKLTNPVSIANGIGPICAQRFS
jgi:hypothetical protein